MATHSDKMRSATDSLLFNTNWKDDFDITPLKSCPELTISRPASPSHNTEYGTVKPFFSPDSYRTPTVLGPASTSPEAHQEELSTYCEQSLLFVARTNREETLPVHLQEHQPASQPPPPPSANGGDVDQVCETLKYATYRARWEMNSSLDTMAAAKIRLTGLRRATGLANEGSAGHAQERQAHAEVLALQNTVNERVRVLEELVERRHELLRLSGKEPEGMEEEVYEWGELWAIDP